MTHRDDRFWNEQIQSANDKMTKDNMPDVIWVRRFNDKPTGIEIVFGEVDNPMFKYHKAPPPMEGLEEDLNIIYEILRISPNNNMLNVYKAAKAYMALSKGE